MTVKNSAGQSNVSPPVIIAVIVVVLIIVGGLAYKFFGPTPTSGPSAAATADDQWLLKVAVQCKGNPALLSGADMHTLQTKYGVTAISRLQQAYMSAGAGK